MARLVGGEAGALLSRCDMAEIAERVRCVHAVADSTPSCVCHLRALALLWVVSPLSSPPCFPHIALASDWLYPLVGSCTCGFLWVLVTRPSSCSTGLSSCFTGRKMRYAVNAPVLSSLFCLQKIVVC